MPMPCAPTARLPRRLAVAVPVLAGLCTFFSLPAQAQVYVRPFGGVYVERYYGPPPAYYPPPPAYYPPPAAYPPPPVYRAPGHFPVADIAPMLRSMGMSAIGRPRVDGNTYLVDATARSGARLRVRIDAYSGEVIAMHPVGQGPVATPAAPAAPARQALPAVPPLPLARPPELAAIPAPEPSAEALPAASSAPSEPQSANEPPLPAAAAAESPAPAPAASSPVRIIPGTAVPPSAMPQAASPPSAASPPGNEAKAPAPPAPATTPAAVPPAGSGTGTGVGTGSTVPAGTASVYARGASAKPEPAEE
ncbi:hypothetical protein [Ancylobacter sp. IITR112]|uniref:hypothetical protein n=1 Tax=Ancylobacter sp. IITR112 TaxID=3138073 RepID=UPI00352B6B31